MGGAWRERSANGGLGNRKLKTTSKPKQTGAFVATPTWAISANLAPVEKRSCIAARTAFDTSSFPADTWTLRFSCSRLLSPSCRRKNEHVVPPRTARDARGEQRPRPCRILHRPQPGPHRGVHGRARPRRVLAGPAARG